MNGRYLVLGGVLAALVAIPVVHMHESPLLDRLPGGDWLFVQGACPATRAAADRIDSDDRLRSAILLVNVGEVGPARCDAFQRQLRDRRHWSGLLPSEYLCRRIGREAESFVDLHFVASPAWARDGAPLPVGVSDPLADLE